MQIVKCPRTGHIRKFANGRAAKRWLREQAEKYVPTVDEDTMAFAGISKVDVDYVLVAPGKLIAKKTGVVHHERTIGGDWCGGEKAMVAGKSVNGALVRKHAGKSYVFAQKAKVDADGKAGTVSHMTEERRLMVKDDAGEFKSMRLAPKPVLRMERRDVSKDMLKTEYEQISQDVARYGLNVPHIRGYAK